MQIKDSVFLIPGGASGLGAATARHLVAAGGKVVIADLNRQAGEKFAARLGANARFVIADVTDEVQVQQAVDAAVKTFGALHGLINCAGVATGERVLGRDGPHRLETFSRVIGVNLIGSFNALRLAANAMTGNPPTADGERGVIINTASVAAFEGQIGQAAYSASKGGIVAMALPVARELARFGIRVMTIAPGIFDTPMLQGMSEEIRASLGAQVPFPSRLGQPREYARLAAFIIENPMLNAEVIRLDGAIRMAPK
ncbi:MAG: 3-hydroxyacyl-CoA dehydrogenase [Betaproteobacteria bacterium]|nr:3-hydroxyacyl-CoA dehydrogenase [Betaproteobacteria bacterium]